LRAMYSTPMRTIRSVAFPPTKQFPGSRSINRTIT
jgi:hypothetical protein